MQPYEQIFFTYITQSAMYSKIVHIIHDLINLTEEECELIQKCIPVKLFKRGEILLEEGQISKESYQNLSGIVRKYYILDGNEITTEFYEEGDSIASFTSLSEEVPARHYLECIEDCELAVLSKEKEEELIKKIPKYEALCRTSLEKDFGKQQDNLGYYLTSSPEQRYLNLLNNRPQLLNRVPLYYIASHIGVKPESLSRIRKRVLKK